MRSKLLTLVALWLPATATASAYATLHPTMPFVRPTITASPSRKQAPSRRQYEPSIPTLSLNLPTISIAAPSIPPLSLDLPVPTCTPGYSAYATPGKDGYVPAEACNALWVYFPNFAAAVAFSILFGILFIAHLVQAIVHHNGYCWVVAMAALWETGAYLFRALGSKDQQSTGVALVAQILVLVAPICRSLKSM